MSSILFRNGVVHSPADPFAEAVLVEDGVVAWLGANDTADGFARRAERVVDLDGALVTPGFVDSHVHLLRTGEQLDGLDLQGARSARDLVQLVPARATLDEGTVGGHGWDETGWDTAETPSREALDAAAGERAVALVRADQHSSLVSTALARELGLADLPGWSHDGPVTGAAHAAVSAHLTQQAQARHDELTTLALRTAAERGIVAVHEMSLPSMDTRAGLADLIARTADPASGLPLVVGYRGELCETTSDVTALREAIPGLTGVGGDLAVDGSLGSRTAALNVPYADDPDGGAGTLHLSTEQITTHVLAATRAGVQAGFHAIGDRALQEVLLGFETAADLEGLAAVRARGHRIEHALMVGAPALAALVLLGLRLSVQPAFDARWGGPSSMYAARLGATRAADTTPLADLAGAGVPLALGSDTPVTPFDPWGAVAGALLLRSADQRISARAAFRAHTRGGWRLAGLDHTGSGEIRLGAPAHLAVWRTEHLAVEGPHAPGSAWSTDARAGTPLLPALGPDEPSPTCHMTMRDGVVLYEQW
ncbi:amidohydrolase [Sanguibacter sp. A247]|uniref:amidohydrolase n=1 Tax=unclassified Sanguibacter TaxID=2645534 RepID=UPI003FD7B977